MNNIIKKFSNCKECMCESVCRYNDGINLWSKGICPKFIDKALFVKLPCKIGTPVFIVNKTMGRVYPGKFRLDDLDQFGRRVFLTKAEAEKAVKGV